MTLSNASDVLTNSTIATRNPRVTSVFPTSEFLILKTMRITNSITEVFLSQYQYDFDETFTNRVEAGLEDRIFYIGRRQIEEQYEYYSISDHDPKEVVSGLATGDSSDGSMEFAELVIQYNYKLEEKNLIDFGGPVNSPTLEIQNTTVSNAYYVDSTKNEELTYDSLSTLGPIDPENLTVSITGTATGTTTIDVEAESISDTGGVFARGTVTRTAFDSSGTETTSTATITSGGGY
jgi:hypothetical protein